MLNNFQQFMDFQAKMYRVGDQFVQTLGRNMILLTNKTTNRVWFQITFAREMS